MVALRRAKMGDVRTMHRLLNHFADKRELLPRAISEIYENLQQFHVAEDEGRLIGVCALYVTWDNLAEVKALAVEEAYHGKGVGKLLLQTCMDDAERLEIRRVFTLTLRTGFFEHFGFQHVTKELLPHKVWTECVRCVYFPDKCVEYAMVKDLPGPAPTPTPIPRPGTGHTAFMEGTIVPVEPTTPGVPPDGSVPDSGGFIRPDARK